MTSDLLWIGLAFLLVVANGFFVAAEFALVKLRDTRLDQFVRSRRTFASSAQWLFRRLDRSLSACQLGITMASLGLGWIGEPAVAHLLEPAFLALGVTSTSVVHVLAFTISFTLITAAHLIVGEQAPKIFAIRQAEKMAIWCAMPLRAFYIATYPLLRALEAATSAILRWFGVEGAHLEAPHDSEELRVILGRSRAHGELSRTEHRLIDAVLEFDDTVCRQIMVPRTEVVVLDAGLTLEQMLRVVRETKHTRYPVGRRSLDDVQGILHVKDLIALSPSASEPFDLRSILRPLKFVPETMRIGHLLSHFQSTRQHMAVVVDEFGATVGVVTLENVLEQIVGPVQDEFDTEGADIVPDGQGRWLVRGGTSIDVTRLAVGLELADETDVDTVAGLIVLRLGRMAAVGDQAELDGARAEVLEVKRNRATLIRLVRVESTSPDQPG